MAISRIATSTMDVLNDDCLIKIVSNLSPIEILKLESISSVTRRWACLYWSQFRKFDIDKLVKEDGPNAKYYIKSILKKSSPFLWEFILMNPKSNFPGLCTKIVDYAPNIQSLIIDIDCDDHDINLLASVLRNLKKLSFYSEYGSDECISYLVGNNQKLEYFKIRRNRYMNGSCLQDLPRKLKELHLDDIPVLEGDALIAAVSELKHLEVISLDSCSSLSNNNLIDIVKLVPNLKHLSLKFLNIDVQSVGDLKHLKSLDISYNNEVNDNVLHHICSNCLELEEIGLGYLKYDNREHLSTYGIMYLSKLHHLKVLKLSRVNFIDETNIKTLPNYNGLEDLRLKNSLSFTDDVALSVLHHCKNLQRLELEYCPITQKTIRHAVFALSNQPHRKTMMKLIIQRPQFRKQISDDFRHNLLQVYINGEDMDH